MQTKSECQDLNSPPSDDLLPELVDIYAAMTSSDQEITMPQATFIEPRDEDGSHVDSQPSMYNCIQCMEPVRLLERTESGVAQAPQLFYGMFWLSIARRLYYTAKKSHGLPE